MDFGKVKNRLMQEPPQMRIGHLAVDLLRIANFVESGSLAIAKPIFRESEWIAEWIAPEAEPRVQELLAEMQSFLALQELRWSDWSTQPEAIHAAAATIRNWSQELLKRSGLVG